MDELTNVTADHSQKKQKYFTYILVCLYEIK